MNESQCREVLVELGSAFPKSKPLGSIDDQVKLWMRHFRGVSIDDMIKTVENWVASGSFFPTIKEFQKHLKAIADVESSDAICHCDGTGYYEVAPRQWIPCPSCLPSTNRRWSEGHFAPGHWCEECARATRGDGPLQPVDERSLVQRPQGRKLTREENLDRLAIMQQLAKEVASMRAADPGRYKRLSRAEIDRYWENRYNELIQGNSTVDATVLEMFNADPGVPVDDEGFEVL